MLTGKFESPKSTDKFKIIRDKIEANLEGEQHTYISFICVNNRADAETAKKIINAVAEKVLGYTYPIIFRRYYQSKVIYQIYVSKYFVYYKGSLWDTWDLITKKIHNVDETDANPKWVEFKKEVNKQLGQDIL